MTCVQGKNTPGRMKPIRLIFLLLILLLSATLLLSCGNVPLTAEEENLVGKWAYSHDPKKAELTIRRDGKAVYGKKAYRFSIDSERITLTDAAGAELSLRYQLNEDGMLLYRQAVYIREEEQDGITGLWSCPAENWSYQFTPQGTFLEDGVFPGYYSVDEEASTFKLMYSSHFEDTVCYYQLDGNSLLVEYPWQMVKIK